MPQGHQGSAAVAAATAAERPASSAGNGELTRGAGSIPATPTYQGLEKEMDTYIDWVAEYLNTEIADIRFHVSKDDFPR